MNRIFILALDGTPYTLLKRLIAENRMPNLKRLAENADFKQMDSVFPAVSSVAWTSFMTGSHPGKHGIYGFVERNPGTMKWFVPLSDRIRAKRIQTNLSDKALKKLSDRNNEKYKRPVKHESLLAIAFESNYCTFKRLLTSLTP